MSASARYEAFEDINNKKTKGVFGNVVLVMLFVYFENKRR